MANVKAIRIALAAQLETTGLPDPRDRTRSDQPAHRR